MSWCHLAGIELRSRSWKSCTQSFQNSCYKLNFLVVRGGQVFNSVLAKCFKMTKCNRTIPFSSLSRVALHRQLHVAKFLKFIDTETGLNAVLHISSKHSVLCFTVDPSKFVASICDVIQNIA